VRRRFLRLLGKSKSVAVNSQFNFEFSKSANINLLMYLSFLARLRTTIAQGQAVRREVILDHKVGR
jgi:hypothetical protein